MAKRLRVTYHTCLQFVKRFHASHGIDLEDPKQRDQVVVEVKRILTNCTKLPGKKADEFYFVNEVEGITFVVKESEAEDVVITCLAKKVKS
jgi:hypothetical protein